MRPNELPVENPTVIVTGGVDTHLEFYNDDDPARAYADLVGEAINLLDHRGEGLAAFLCDSIFDSQGGLDAPPGYFSAVYDRVRDAGGLCIADEVQAGMGRTGTMWGFEHDDVVPDIVTFGKPAGNGFPLGGVITSQEIVERFNRDNFYFNTFGGNPVQAATGLEVLREIQERDLCGRAADVGGDLLGRLHELAERHRIIGEVRGRGLYCGLDLVTDRTTKNPSVEIARQIPDAMKEAGVLLGMTGRFGNVLKIRPPLVFERENSDLLVERLDQVLRQFAT